MKLNDGHHVVLRDNSIQCAAVAGQLGTCLDPAANKLDFFIRKFGKGKSVPVARP